MWTFKISAGEIYHFGVLVGKAYSGAPGFIDNPLDENLKDKGPLPEGWYTMSRAIDSEDTGPVSIPLIPDSTNEEYGRSAFLIHGDNIHAPGTGSHGCIVAPRELRKMIDTSADARLNVIA